MPPTFDANASRVHWASQTVLSLKLQLRDAGVPLLREDYKVHLVNAMVMNDAVEFWSEQSDNDLMDESDRRDLDVPAAPTFDEIANALAEADTAAAQVAALYSLKVEELQYLLHQSGGTPRRGDLRWHLINSLVALGAWPGQPPQPATAPVCTKRTISDRTRRAPAVRTPAALMRQRDATRPYGSSAPPSSSASVISTTTEEFRAVARECNDETILKIFHEAVCEVLQVPETDQAGLLRALAALRIAKAELETRDLSTIPSSERENSTQTGSPSSRNHASRTDHLATPAGLSASRYAPSSRENNVAQAQVSSRAGRGTSAGLADTTVPLSSGSPRTTIHHERAATDIGSPSLPSRSNPPAHSQSPTPTRTSSGSKPVTPARTPLTRSQLRIETDQHRRHTRADTAQRHGYGEGARGSPAVFSATDPPPDILHPPILSALNRNMKLSFSTAQRLDQELRGSFSPATAAAESRFNGPASANSKRSFNHGTDSTNGIEADDGSMREDDVSAETALCGAMQPYLRWLLVPEMEAELLFRNATPPDRKGKKDWARRLAEEDLAGNTGHGWMHCYRVMENKPNATRRPKAWKAPDRDHCDCEQRMEEDQLTF